MRLRVPSALTDTLEYSIAYHDRNILVGTKNAANIAHIVAKLTNGTYQSDCLAGRRRECNGNIAQGSVVKMYNNSTNALTVLSQCVVRSALDVDVKIPYKEILHKLWAVGTFTSAALCVQ